MALCKVCGIVPCPPGVPDPGFVCSTCLRPPAETAKSKDTGNTDPVGKTEEQLELEELREENEELHQNLLQTQVEIEHARRKEARDEKELAHLRRQEARLLTQRGSILPMVAMSLLLMVMGVVCVYGWRELPEAVAAACPAPPPPVECPEPVPAPAPDLSHAPTTALAPDGYIVEGEFGMPHVVPWPDSSHYPAETFQEDCRAVCALPAPMRTEPGRVLVSDPAHLVCICLHPDGAWPVTRWINWEHVR